jgi:hypothetical protein
MKLLFFQIEGRVLWRDQRLTVYPAAETAAATSSGTRPTADALLPTKNDQSCLGGIDKAAGNRLYDIDLIDKPITNNYFVSAKSFRGVAGS